ncbi:patatin-like phospholipase family protein [Paraglaciecola sp.]|jgi:NTE family protein|uniref:patatin-like phospholipase family protein n=1 Tax=Paraglaciecola sp. TaxID=1920173 RepID=UPI00273D0D7C|nr:patatin-like phospholipase family protein [Paraglaciecola sp.]MDP5032415.1 patatin-like phospholipase family protein [Paraglaciecola sp.]
MLLSQELTKNQIVPIFSGGGTRLPCYIGILQALEELELKFSHVVGVSGGSIVAALLADGKNRDELKKLALETDFKQFRGFSVVNLIRTGGLSSGDTFENWMDTQLQGRTFAEMQLDLHVLATDINGGGPVVFNRANTPDVKVSTAVRYSMSIPLLFSFKTFKNHVMADGVILAEDALHQDWSGRGIPVICFRLKSENEDKPVKTRRLFPLVSYITMLIQTFMSAMSREYVHAQYWHNTVLINTGNISSVDFSLPLEKKLQLLDQGYNTVMAVIPQKFNWVVEQQIQTKLVQNNKFNYTQQ